MENQVGRAVSVHIGKVGNGLTGSSAAPQIDTPSHTVLRGDLRRAGPADGRAAINWMFTEVVADLMCPTAGRCFEDIRQPVPVQVDEINQRIVHDGKRCVLRAGDASGRGKFRRRMTDRVSITRRRQTGDIVRTELRHR